jgi:ubiquinone/menaquinone biosynthesis C-methylase UbiE
MVLRVIPRVLEPEVMDTAEEAADYDAMDHVEVNARFAADFAAFLGSRAAPRLLDVGTGTARIPILLCQGIPAASVVAADLSREMLAIAKANVDRVGLGQRISFAVEDAKALSFPSEVFDGVVSNTTLHHVPEPAVALAEMWRVVKKGGAIFVRDLVRPESQIAVAALVTKYGGPAPPADAVSTARHARQVALFEASLLAGLTVAELRAMVAPLGIPASAVQMTSDRHWTLEHDKEP